MNIKILKLIYKHKKNVVNINYVFFMRNNNINIIYNMFLINC